MSFMSAVAGGGGVLADVAKACGLDAASAQSAMDALCPAIAGRLQEKAKDDSELLGTLLDLLDDNSASDGPAGEEAMLDGGAVLKALYGSKAAAAKALQGVVPAVPASALAVLAPVSAAAVIGAVSHQQATPLAGAMPLAGGSIFSTIVSAIIAGAVKEAVRQIKASGKKRTSTSTTRTSTRSRKRAAPKKSRTTRKRSTSGINLEDILGGIFGTKSKQE